MREIKFRAWDKTEQKMHEWDYLIGYCDLDWLFGDHASFRPDIEVMQYTGLKDMNGVEIYEGDIVNIAQNGWATDEYRGVIVEYCGVRGYSPWDECSGQIDIDYLASAHSEDIEVIGNIHENPVLVNT